MCPQYVGPEANDALHEAIRDFVDGELEAALREEVSSSLIRGEEHAVKTYPR